MILDHPKATAPTHDLAMMPTENPPSYDLATGSEFPADQKSSAPKTAQPPAAPAYLGAGPSQHPHTPVYHYQHPATGEHIASLLPPDHPEMICLQEGMHLRETRFGLLGILAAVFWFPLGVGLCLLDRKVHCRRCGLSINEGLCG